MHNKNRSNEMTETNMLTLIAIPTACDANDARLRELETAIRCGSPGCAGFDDSPVKRVCPGYGQN